MVPMRLQPRDGALWPVYNNAPAAPMTLDACLLPGQSGARVCTAPGSDTTSCGCVASAADILDATAIVVAER